MPMTAGFGTPGPPEGHCDLEDAVPAMSRALRSVSWRALDTGQLGSAAGAWRGGEAV